MILTDDFEENQGKLMSNLHLLQFLSNHVSDFSSTDFINLTEDEKDKPRKQEKIYLNLADSKSGLFAYGSSILFSIYGFWNGYKRRDKICVFDFDSDNGKLMPIFSCVTNSNTDESARKSARWLRSLMKRLVFYVKRKDAKTFVVNKLKELLQKRMR